MSNFIFRGMNRALTALVLIAALGASLGLFAGLSLAGEVPADKAASTEGNTFTGGPAASDGSPAKDLPMFSDAERVQPASLHKGSFDAKVKKGARPTPASSPPAARKGKKGDESPSADKDEVALNLDNADIYEVIKTFGEVFNLNYVIDPAVKGTVNINTRGKISRDDLFDIFLNLFKVNGAAAVKEGKVYHIVPITGVKSRLLSLDRGKKVGRSNDMVRVQVVRLSYIPASDAAEVLQPFLTEGATIKVYIKNNMLFITDFASNISKLIQIVDILDNDLFEKVRVKLYPVKQTDVKDVSGDMEALFSAIDLPSGGAGGFGVKFIPINRLNSLLVVSSVKGVFAQIEKWLSVFDSISTSEDEKIFIYQVKNGISTELADILQSILSQKNPDKQESASKEAARPGPAVEKTKKGKAQKGKKSFIERTTDTVHGKVKVIAFPTTNTLVIKSSQRDFIVIKKILAELDIMPRQVLIELVMAEVTLSDKTSLGMQYAFMGNELSTGVRKSIVGTSLGLSAAGTLATGGLTATLLQNNFQVALNALATKNKVNILASPRIIASDGKEASIDIGDEVPLVASKIFIDQREEVTIERRNTGVIVKMTPHINSTGLVTLDVDLELSDAANVALAGETDIRIFQRNAATTMVVQDSKTVVIGGLISSKVENGATRVPIISRIPIFGNLFKNNSDNMKRTELILLITPHVIRSLNEADSVTSESIAKLKGLKEYLKQVDIQGATEDGE